LGTSTLKLTPGIGELPVFVRAGAIIPEQAVVQHEGEVPSGPLQLHVYPGPNCQGELYTDDGHSLAYQRGSSLRRRFSCTVGEGKVTVHISAEAGQYAPWWREIAVIVHDSAAPKAPLPAIQRYDAKTHTITAIVAEMRSAMDVVVAHE
jgi:alpha-glucosidase